VQQFTRDANNSCGLSESIFIPAQYDVLRRLRVYWVPRYLLHKEYLNELGFVQYLICDGSQRTTAVDEDCTAEVQTFFRKIFLGIAVTLNIWSRLLKTLESCNKQMQQKL